MQNILETLQTIWDKVVPVLSGVPAGTILIYLMIARRIGKALKTVLIISLIVFAFWFITKQLDIDLLGGLLNVKA